MSLPLVGVVAVADNGVIGQGNALPGTLQPTSSAFAR